MARDASPWLPTAGITRLQESAAVVALVPAERHYPPQRPPNPEWPFIGWGAPVAVPFVASCLDGSTTTVAVHAYAETTGEGDETVAGSDLAGQINAAVALTLDGAEINLAEYGCPFPATAHFAWTGSQVVQDNADASAFHGFSTYAITVTS